MDLLTTAILICAIIAHWIANFVCQAEVWAINKKHSSKALLTHTLTYSGVMTLLWLGVLCSQPSFTLFFFLSMLISHTTIDFVTSKIVGKRFEDKYLGGPIPNLGAFTMIRLDQVLHYVTIFLTLHFLL